MLRAVLDPNVIVSAFIQPGGRAGRLLRRWLEERSFGLVVSPSLMDEVRRALRYPRVRRYLRVPEEEIEISLGLMERTAEMVEEDLDVERIAPDPGDDVILATAIAGEAQFLVTGDRGLLQLRRHAGIRIVRPATFLELLA